MEKTDWEEEISLFELVEVLLKRKWLIIVITLITMLIALAAWKFMSQTYKAEFTVSFIESSFLKEFKGEIAITYQGKEKPTYVPYSFSPPQESRNLPENALLSFTRKETLAELAAKEGFKDLFEKAVDTLSVNIAPQEKTSPEETEEKKFLVVITTANEELCKKVAPALASKIEEELIFSLKTQHNNRLAFYKELLKTMETNQKAAKGKLLEFLESNDPLRLDREIEKVQVALNALLEQRKALLSQQNTPLISLPLSVEDLEKLSLMPLERIYALEKEIEEEYRKELVELEQEIEALRQEKAKLELEKLKQDELINTYNRLLQDYTFWKEVQSSLLLFLSPAIENKAYLFDGKVEVGTIEYSGGKKNLKLNLAVGLVAGLFLGVFVAFFAEFWGKAKLKSN